MIRRHTRRAIEVYLDTNAISAFVPAHDGEVLLAAELRRRLKAACRYRQLTVLSSVVTVQELMGLAETNWPRYSQILRLLFGFVRMNVIEDARELWLREYRLGRGARGSERLSSGDLVREPRKQSVRPDLAADVMRDVRAFQDRFKAEEDARRENVRARFAEHLKPGDDPARAVREWWEEAEEHIADWARSTLASMLDGHGIPHPDLRDYDVRRLPTLWNFHAYKLARIEMNVGHHRRIDASDPVDAHHYALGAYAAVFVSDDKAMTETCQAIPGRAVAPMRLQGFARSYLPFAV